MLPLDAPAYLVLPSPISTNNLFATLKKDGIGKAAGGRIVTKEYRAWKHNADQRLFAQRPLPRFTGPVTITLFVGERGVGQMDSDNTAKAYLDCLVRAKIIRDDARAVVRSTRAVWVPGMSGCVAEILPARAAPNPEAIMSRVPRGLHELLK